MLLIATLIWGVYGYTSMPQRKDPDIPVREAQIICPWPGMTTDKVEQLVTRTIELKVAENTHIKKIESTSRVGLSVITVALDDEGSGHRQAVRRYQISPGSIHTAGGLDHPVLQGTRYAALSSRRQPKVTSEIHFGPDIEKAF